MSIRPVSPAEAKALNILNGTDGAAPEIPESGVKGAFTAFELAFNAWMVSEWPHWNSPTTVFYWQKRAAFRAGFDAGVGLSS